MNINQLISIIENKIKDHISLEKITIEDKTFLHKKHNTNEMGKFHIKINISSFELSKLSKLERTKKIYKILDNELKIFIHSIQISIN